MKELELYINNPKSPKLIELKGNVVIKSSDNFGISLGKTSSKSVLKITRPNIVVDGNHASIIFLVDNLLNMDFSVIKIMPEATSVTIKNLNIKVIVSSDKNSSRSISAIYNLARATNIENVKINMKSNSQINLFGIRNYSDIRPPHYSEKSVCFCLENASILKISDEELPSVLNLLSIKYNSVESSAYAISKLYPKIKLIIITLGDNGSFCLNTETNNTYYSEAVKTKVVSTVGAGDSFGAAFLASYFKDHDIKRALKTASHISSYVVSSIEAIPKGAKAIFESI